MQFHIMSLNLGHELYYAVIDCWAAVLNFDEKRKRRCSFRRLFCGTSPFYGWVLNGTEETYEQRLDFFKVQLHAILKKRTHLCDLRQFDAVLFPIIDNHHYYLVTLDLKNPSIRVIDNMNEGQNLVGLHDDLDFIKKDTAFKVKYIFMRYLRLVDHPKCNEIEVAPIEKMKIYWATTKKFVDCGIYVMRHMEMFKGNNDQSWDCGFTRDEKTKKAKLTLLRRKYAYKILTSEVNIYRDKVLKEAEDLAKENKK